MKRIVSLLLALALMLALTGTAMADCKFKAGDRVEFTRNAALYDDHHNSDKTDTIIRKGSFSVVKSTCGDKWVELYLDPNDLTNTKWFKAGDLKKTDKYAQVRAGNKLWTTYVLICYSNGGVGRSGAYLGPWADTGEWLSEGGYRISVDDCKHVKVNAKVWLHKEPSLKKSYGKALHKDDKVVYRRQWALDSRVVPFLGVRYEGKCLWVSMLYADVVK